MIGTRSRASLSQYLERQQQDRTELILNKYGINTPEVEAGYGLPAISLLGKIHNWLRDAKSESIEQVLAEIVRTEQSFYYARTSNAQVYKERYQDLTACLALDGYLVRDGEFLQAEPTLDAAPLARR